VRWKSSKDEYAEDIALGQNAQSLFIDNKAILAFKEASRK